VERGTSTLGSGTVKAYLYLPREAFTLDYYTAAYVRVSGAAEMTAFYSDYDDYIDAVIDELGPAIEGIDASEQRVIDEILIATDGTKPAAFKTATADYTTAKTALVNVAALKAQIAHESNYVEANYTADSWKAYSDALKAAKAKLVDGTTDSVAAALTALTAAENALVRTTTPPDTTVLDETIADMEKVNGSEYTTDSYKALTDAIAKAKSDKVKGDAGLNQQNIDAMKAAKEALVSTVELKAKVAEAGKVDSSKYTTASYEALSKLLAAKDDTTSDPVVKGLDTLYKSGTVKELAERVAAIDAAVAKLDARATGVKDYVDGIKLKDNDKGYYTDASYKAYSDAYKALKKLAAAGEGETDAGEDHEA